MREPAKKIVLRIDSPCPCGSGKPIARCHLGLDGHFRKPLRSLRPPGPPTGFSHQHCYLRDIRDCSDQISREHYMSKSVLNQFGQVVRVSGMPWLAIGETFDTSVASLTAKILCTRHNAALSPLDDEAALFFSVLRKALIDLGRKTLSKKPIFHLVGGDALELWMLKVACGLYFAIGSRDGTRIAETHTIDLAKVRAAFFDRDWEARAGLYFQGNVGTRVTVQDSIGMSPLSMDSERRFCGSAISLHGFTLECLFDARGANPGVWTGLVKRPTELILRKKQREHHIIVTWPPGTPEQSITLEEG
jgi:hypothetical protein